MAIYYFSLISRMLLNMNVTLLFCYGQPSACFVCCDSIPNKLTADDLNFNLSRFGFNPRSVDTATTQHSHIAVDCNNMSMSLTCALFVFIRTSGSLYIIRSIFYVQPALYMFVIVQHSEILFTPQVLVC